MVYLLISFIAYLIGSLPFGLILSNMFHLGDLRTIGSGNIGATNVLRTGNKYLAAFTLFLDMIKGTLVLLLSSTFFPSDTFAIFISGFFVFLGHIFPVWLHFKGGKGVATYLGILVFFSWQSALIFTLIWILFIKMFRYSSLSSLISVTLTPLLLYFLDGFVIAMFFFIMSLFIWERHFLNLQRLYKGKELKIKY